MLFIERSWGLGHEGTENPKWWGVWVFWGLGFFTVPWEDRRMEAEEECGVGGGGGVGEKVKESQTR